MPAPAELPPTRALAWLYCPSDQRPLLAALCALEREIGASLAPGLDHQVAHTRLAWWREECARCARGGATHPLTRELALLLAPFGDSLAGLAGFVDTAVWDLAAATFATRRELTGYCERWSAAMIAPLVRFAAPALDGARARTLGAGLREIELMLSLAPDARAGRLRVPLDELELAAIAPGELSRPPWPSGLSRLLQNRHRELRAALASNLLSLAPAAQAALRGLIVWAALDCAHSARAQALLPRAVGEERASVFDGFRAWRAARSADAGRGVGRQCDV